MPIISSNYSLIYLPGTGQSSREESTVWPSVMREESQKLRYIMAVASSYPMTGKLVYEKK